jgi:23S rRNA pseudouridine1911/1915/1917 synthase
MAADSAGNASRADRGFEILYEQGACLAVCKPAGLPTQAPAGIESLETRLKAYLLARREAAPDAVAFPFNPKSGLGLSSPQGKIQNPKSLYLALPHRLDRAVSGAMVFATERAAARKLSRQFERRQVKKIYWACVAGPVEPPAGTWSDLLWKVHGQPRAVVVDAAHPGGRQATLHYRTLGSGRYGSWLEIELETGRTHQVRVQAASRCFPLLGDAHYGSQIPFGPQHEDERRRAIALHARRLTFQHPTTREEITVVAPLPDAWRELGLDLAGVGED